MSDQKLSKLYFHSDPEKLSINELELLISYLSRLKSQKTPMNYSQLMYTLSKKLKLKLSFTYTKVGKLWGCEGCCDDIYNNSINTTKKLAKEGVATYLYSVIKKEENDGYYDKEEEDYDDEEDYDEDKDDYDDDYDYEDEDYDYEDDDDDDYENDDDDYENDDKYDDKEDYEEEEEEEDDYEDDDFEDYEDDYNHKKEKNKNCDDEDLENEYEDDFEDDGNCEPDCICKQPTFKENDEKQEILPSRPRNIENFFSSLPQHEQRKLLNEDLKRYHRDAEYKKILDKELNDYHRNPCPAPECNTCRSPQFKETSSA